jgi:uncharacterized protein
MVPLDVLGVSAGIGQFQPVVLLKHEDRILPIMVGLAEADAIQGALMNRDLGRPMTHDLICNLLAGLRGQVTAVVIYKLEENTFYAHLDLEQRSATGQVEQILKIDSRPSDGIAIALRVKCPIYAAVEVMNEASTDAQSILGIVSEGEEGEEGDEDEGDEEEDEGPESDFDG